MKHSIEGDVLKGKYGNFIPSCQGPIMRIDNKSYTRVTEAVLTTLGDIQVSNGWTEAKNENDCFVDATDLYFKEK